MYVYARVRPVQPTYNIVQQYIIGESYLHCVQKVLKLLVCRRTAVLEIVLHLFGPTTTLYSVHLNWWQLLIETRSIFSRQICLHAWLLQYKFKTIYSLCYLRFSVRKLVLLLMVILA